MRVKMILREYGEQVSYLMIEVFVEVIPCNLDAFRKVCTLFQFQNLSDFFKLGFSAGRCSVLFKTSKESFWVFDKV